MASAKSVEIEAKSTRNAKTRVRTKEERAIFQIYLSCILRPFSPSYFQSYFQRRLETRTSQEITRNCRFRFEVAVRK